MRDAKLAFRSDFGAAEDYIKVFVVIAALSVGAYFGPLSYHAMGYLFLFAVIALSLGISRWPALAAAVMSGLAWDYFCVPPKLSLAGIHFDESLLLTTYFAVALLGSQLTALRLAADRAGMLAQSEQMHQTLLDSVAHELRTPVSVFRSAIEQLATPDHLKRERAVIELRIATHRLDSLVTNLLNQNRLEAGMLRPNMDWCEARELVASARHAAGQRMGDHPVAADFPEDLPIFRADAALMEQAIAQLLLNAAMHTPPGTEVRVSAATALGPGRMLISVSDDGPGLPEEVRGTLFEKFKRGANARKGGLGLGLSIVRGFMRAQGGEVSYEGPGGGGARFTLSLPLATPDENPLP